LTSFVLTFEAWGSKEMLTALTPLDAPQRDLQDGVLKKGEEVFPEAKRALQLLEDRRIPWITITNGGGVPDETRRAALSRELGVEVSRLVPVDRVGQLRAV
jgi:hypothetical protein